MTGDAFWRRLLVHTSLSLMHWSVDTGFQPRDNSFLRWRLGEASSQWAKLKACNVFWRFLCCVLLETGPYTHSAVAPVLCRTGDCCRQLERTNSGSLSEPINSDSFRPFPTLSRCPIFDMLFRKQCTVKKTTVPLLGLLDIRICVGRRPFEALQSFND